MTEDRRKALPNPHPLDAVVLNVLEKCSREGPTDALWTADIAHGAMLPVRLTRAALDRLEASGKVRRAVSGRQVSWKIAT